jgi:SAM-dependent methyltransferase
MWNGPYVAAWAQHPERYDAMLDQLGRQALDAARLQPGERVLDVGCGSGQLARQAAERVAPGGHVLGVDVSSALIDVARSRGGADYLLADAQEHAFEEGFDVVISRFGVMFFPDPVAAFTNLRRTGDRLCFVAWQAAPRNPWVMIAVGAMVPHVGIPRLAGPGDPGPFSFGDPARVRSVLAQAGWRDVAVTAVEQDVLVGGATDVDSAVDFFRQDTVIRMMLRDVDPAQQEAGFGALREAVELRISADGLRLGAAAWLVTAS